MTDCIYLPKSVQDDIIAHAKDTLPNECCGYITGKGNAGMTVYPMTNVDASPVHFSFDPQDQFRVIKAARAKGEVPLVVYHSHPESPARLSNEDLRLLTDPEMVYVIVSLHNNAVDIKAYRINNRNVIPVMIREGGL
jgi:proteasome lid subunit RPN8/RPN11